MLARRLGCCHIGGHGTLHGMVDQHLQQGADPFLFEGNKIGCLLLHGLTGSPYSQRWLGEHLNQQGYTVMAPLLPGHGTTPQHLAQVTWRDWYAAAREGYEQLQSRCEQIFCCSLSMGTLLTMILASKERLDGAILMSVPYQIEPTWRRFAIQAVGWVGGMWPKDLDNADTVRLRAEVRAEQEKREGKTYKSPGYDVWPLKAVHQLAKLQHAARTAISDVTTPVLFIHARQDLTAPYEHMQHFYDLIGSSQKECLTLETGGHVTTQDLARYQVYDAVADFIARQVSQGNA